MATPVALRGQRREAGAWVGAWTCGSCRRTDLQCGPGLQLAPSEGCLTIQTGVSFQPPSRLSFSAAKGPSCTAGSLVTWTGTQAPHPQLRGVLLARMASASQSLPQGTLPPPSPSAVQARALPPSCARSLLPWAPVALV